MVLVYQTFPENEYVTLFWHLTSSSPNRNAQLYLKAGFLSISETPTSWLRSELCYMVNQALLYQESATQLIDFIIQLKKNLLNQPLLNAYSVSELWRYIKRMQMQVLPLGEIKKKKSLLLIRIQSIPFWKQPEDIWIGCLLCEK